MILGFFDDSGKESDVSNRIVCAAGYIAAGNTFWNSFQEMWKNTLLMHGLDSLHMKEVMFSGSTKEPYSKWDWQKKRQVLEDFSVAIKASRLVGFGVAVDADVWRDLPPELTKIEGTAQEFCFTRLIKLIVERLKNSLADESISIMFDCDEGFTPPRFKRYLRIRDRYPSDKRFLNSFGVGEPSVYLPLQAADFLAWESRTHLLREMGGFEARPEFQHIMKVLPGFFPDYTSEYWDREEIDRLIKPMASTV